MNTTKEDAFDELDDVEDKVQAKTRKRPVKQKAQTDYEKNGHRRFRCQVNSLRKGIQVFELMMPHPKDINRPVPVRGRCGVIIEDGLTQYVIDRLNEEYHIETVEDNAAFNNPDNDQGVTHKTVMVPHYQVRVFGEVENPKPVGTIK